MTEPRFDIIYDEKGCRIDYHFCREWDDEGGCYGTRKDHGFSFEEAKKEVASWYEERAKMWKKVTFEEWDRGEIS